MKLLYTLIILLLSCSTEPEDCAGVAGGVATVDDCGQCIGGTTGNVANYLKDCAGICGGTTTQETCDECESQDFDCAGVCDGTAVQDECGICNGDNTTCEGWICTTDYPGGIIPPLPDFFNSLDECELVCPDGLLDVTTPEFPDGTGEQYTMYCSEIE